MKKLIQLFLFIPLFLLMGCDVMTYHTFSSYVTVYCDYDDIALSLSDNGNIRINYDTIFTRREYHWNSTGQEKVTYDSLCKVNNDLGYNKKREYIVSPDWGYCSTFNISQIDVVSNKNFDELHTAGVLLNDIIYFVSASPKKYIDSGYTYSYNWKNNTPEIFNREPELTYSFFLNGIEEPNYSPIVRKLSEIQTNELVLLPPYCFGYLIFESSPTSIKEQTLTVTFSLSNGKTMSKSIEKTFD
ncbi:MAG: hypothetical protein ACK5KP_11995 [Paludibacteraceae bacterium]